jgi:[NiFe] hydrogenase assembly HybE family chaperone
MTDPQQVAERIEAVFKRIHQERMQGIPLLNEAIGVQAVGFQEWDGRCIGVIVTPWLMSLVMLPGPGDDWSGMPLGEKHLHEFPARPCEFLANDIEEFGACQTHAIHSPMSKFPSHYAAVDAAEDFLTGLMDASAAKERDLDAERMQRFLDGDEMDLIRQEELDREAAQAPGLEEKMEQPLSRRDLLRGSFLKEG